MENDPTVLNTSMVVADLSHLSIPKCESLVTDAVYNLPLLKQIDDSTGLPIIKIIVNGKLSRVLLDTGSRLNLVSKSFLINELNANVSGIRESRVMIKGVSGNVFPAVGEINLSCIILGRSFVFNFVIINKSSFPADLLLSYTSIKSLFSLENVFLSLPISDSSRLSYERDMMVDWSMKKVENECMGCESGCEFCCSVENSTEFTSDISHKSEVIDDVCVNEKMLLQVITGEDFHRFRVNVDDLSTLDNVCDITVSLSDQRDISECNFTDISPNAKVGLVCLDESETLTARLSREVTLMPDQLTKVCLVCEEVDNSEVLIVNDKFLYPDVDIDNTFVRGNCGNFFVYARSNNGKSVRLFPGDVFCSLLIMKDSSVTLSMDALPCMNADDDDPDSIRQELHMSDFVEASDQLINLLIKFKGVVALSGDSLGRTDLLNHSITLKDEATPFFVPNYRLPIGRREIVDKIVAEMKEQGVVSESKSPYNSPLLLVPKKSGEWRLVIDFRRLNSMTVPDRMPMPVLDEVLASLNGAKVFSSLDLLSGYWQMPLDENSKPLTAFSTHKEHLQFEVLPFGLCNAPLSFVRLMNVVLGNIPNVHCYLDDIIIYSTCLESHLKTLEIVLQRLRDAGLKIKLKKCRFFMRKLDFLGHTITPDGIHMQAEKVDTIVNYPPPKNVKSLRRFLGISSYYRAFIKDYASIAFPLTDLLKNNVEFTWGEGQRIAFEKLKQSLTQFPILQYPNFNAPFYLACDASNVGVGAVLLQKHEKKLMPVSFASRVLSPTERNYSVTERELLAIVWALKKFRHTILGFPVHVITDHLPVVDLFKKRAFVQNAKFNRWFIHIFEFNPQFKYLPGKYNTIADGLSRIGEEDDQDNNKTSFSFVIQDSELDMDNVKFEQERDSEIVRIVGDIKCDADSRHNYVLLNGLLYLKPYKNGGCARLYVPEPLRLQVLELVHSHRLAGHPGVAKTMRHLSRNFFWPGCKSDIKKFVSNCSTCQIHKGNLNKPAPLEILPSQLLPFHTVSMDIMGPFPTTEEGYRFVLVFSDYLSRYMEICPIKDKTSVSVAEALKHRVITRHSCPRVLLSDNAREFVSQVIQDVCKFYDIHKCQIVAYKPSSNGLVERANKAILSILRTLITPTTSDWHLFLDDVQFTLNNSINESVGESPHFILYGYDGRMPHSLLDDAVPPRPTYDYRDYVAYRTKQSFEVTKKVREMLSKSSKSRKIQYDRNTVVPSAQLGQKVYVIKHVRDGPLFKVSPKFDGPYRIVEILKFNKYRLRHVVDGIERVSHWNHLKIMNNDIDITFVKNDDVEVNNPVSLQEDDKPLHGYNLRSGSRN